MPTPTPPRRSIPPLVLLSFAVLHSQVYWLYSIIYHLCNNLSDRPLDLSLDTTVLQALGKRSGRARAFSEPQPTCALLQQCQSTRPRSTTICATTVDADGSLQRQQWLQQFQACVEQPLDEIIADERSGRTRPPRWWQRTKRHLTRHENPIDHQLISNTQRRPLAKMRSVWIKSQIEPDNLKRRTILGIPAPWPPGKNESLGPKRRLFSSLPAWKRKSVA